MGKNAILASVIALVAVVAIIAILVASQTSDTDWSWDWDSDGDDDSGGDYSIKGEWSEEVIIYFSDGTSQYLKTLMDNQGKSLTVFIGDKEVESASYILKASATGSGYTECEVDYTDLKILAGTSPYISGFGVQAFKFTSDPHKYLSLNSQEKTEIAKATIYFNNPEFGFTTVDSGTYHLGLDPGGEVRYRGTGGGYPNGAWQTVSSLPPGKILVLTVQGPWINLDLSATVEEHYADGSTKTYVIP